MQEVVLDLTETSNVVSPRKLATDASHLLLDNHARLKGKANVDQADFVAIFTGAIL